MKGSFEAWNQQTEVNFRSADLYRIENEITTGHWDVIDQLDLLKQTGTLLLGRR